MTEKDTVQESPWEAKLAEGAQWPIFGAWCSNLTAFTICGEAMMFLIRKSPRGTIAGVMAHLEYQGWGLDELGVFNSASEAEFREGFLEQLPKAGQFLLREIPFDLAARLLWASAAYRDTEFDPGFVHELRPYERFVPPPAGSGSDWFEWMRGSEGYIRPRFLEFGKRSAEAKLPPGKELMTLTEATFQVTNPARLVTALGKSKKEFEPVESAGGTRRYCWTRAYPRGHWSPLKQFGGRQVIGDVSVTGDRLTIETKTPSWSGRFSDWLERKMPGQTALVEVTWKGLDDFLGSTKKKTPSPGAKKAKAGARTGRSRSSTGRVSSDRMPLSEDELLGLHIDTADYEALLELPDYHPIALEILSSAQRNPRSGNVLLKGAVNALRKLTEDLKFHLDERRVRLHRGAYERAVRQILDLISCAENAD